MPKRKTDANEQPLSDEYAVLKEELQQLAERGRDDRDESSPGREIAFAGFVLQSRYGTLVRTDESAGLPTATFTTTRQDRRGAERTQRFMIGLGCEVATKDIAYRSENIAGRRRVVSEFEATKNAPQLLLQTIEAAQDAGDKVQRKIDEENYEHFPAVTAQATPASPVAREVHRFSAGCRVEPVPVATFGRLMAIVEQVIEKQLGAKLDRVDILCAHYADAHVVAFADGSLVDSVMPRLTISVEVRTRTGNTTFGAIRGAGGGIEILSRAYGTSPEEAVTRLAQRVAQDAIDRERAQGTMALGTECPVIFGPHAAGVLVHEVWGHAMEADIICANRRSKTAKLILKGRIGAQVSSNSALTVVDCGEPTMDLGDGHCIEYGWGSIAHDDRGQKPKRTVLIQNGVLVNVMSDELTINEVLDGLKPEVARAIVEHGLSGNVRRERYDNVALVRMTNTYALGNPDGPRSLAEVAALVPKNKRGVYMQTCAGGWVQPDTGDFCIKGSLGFLIENGVVTDKPVRDFDVVGNIAKFGDEIKAIGHAVTATDHFSGYCGKQGQLVPVDSAAPLIYVENAKIGGGSYTYRFDEIFDEYLRQLDERRAGHRERVYVPAIEEISGITDHSNLCLVAASISPEDEVRLILGRACAADFERDADGRLVARWEALR